MGAADREAEPVSREELHEALRFVYAMAMQGRTQLGRMDAILAALVGALLEAKRLDRRRVEDLLADATRRINERAGAETAIDVGSCEDKYAVESPPELDCAALLPICQGRCCRLTFPLSFQDLDEGVVRWTYAAPYRIRQREDGYCVHSDPDNHSCGVYRQRPAVCRGYDCRGDKRIWLDFAQRIPAPPEAIKRPPELHQVRRKPSDEGSRMDDGEQP
jgi:Fe-S-cluster containining protein